MKEAGKKHIGKEYPAPDDQPGNHTASHESLERRISAVQEGVEVVNKKVTLLIRFLGQTLSPDPLVQEQRVKEAQNFQSMQELQDKVDKHILDVGLDIASRMGGFSRPGGLP